MSNLGKEIWRKIKILFNTKEKILVLNIYFGRIDTSDSIGLHRLGHTPKLLEKMTRSEHFHSQKGINYG